MTKEKTKEEKRVCEMCEEELTEENESDNFNRCLSCYEEWGDGWADRAFG